MDRCKIVYINLDFIMMVIQYILKKGWIKKYLDILQNQGYNIKEEKDNPNFGSVQAGIYHIKNKKTEIANDVGTR